MTTKKPGAHCRSAKSIRRLLKQVARSQGEKRPHGPLFHPFPARMPVWLAQNIVESLSSVGETVLDPMAGSGSTAIASLQACRSVVGTDIDPMALLLSRVATTAYHRSAATNRLKLILERAKRRVACGLRVSVVREAFDLEGREFLKYWFPERSQKQVYSLAMEVAAVPAGKYRDLAWVTLSSLIIAKSAGVSYALDISRSRPHKVKDKAVPDAFETWQRRSKIVVARLPFTTKKAPPASVQIKHADARKLPLKPDSIDLVVTSPPYLNAIDYMRTHKFSLVWMGHDLSDLRNVRSDMIGTERGMYKADGLPAQIEKTIVSDIDDSSRLGMVRRYLSDMHRVLLEINRVLKPGGAAIIALGPSLIARGEADAGAVVGALAKSVGLQEVGASFRPLKDGRRSLPPPKAVNRDNALRLRMEGETFLGLLKR